jgi:hypothetical protein
MDLRKEAGKTGGLGSGAGTGAAAAAGNTGMTNGIFTGMGGATGNFNNQEFGVFGTSQTLLFPSKSTMKLPASSRLP